MSLQPPTKPVYIKACGVATSVGLTVEQTASAVQGGVSAYQSSSVQNKHFQPMTMALVPEDLLPPIVESIAGGSSELTSRQIRMLKLAQLALSDLSGKFEEINGLPLMMAGPETFPGMQQASHPDFIEQLSQQTNIDFHERHNVLLPLGRAGGIRALYYAMAYLEAGMSEYALVGGVDTYLDLYLLHNLDLEDRVLAEGVMDGFAPGEGAGFFVISSRAEPFEKSGQSICIYPPGQSHETGHRFSEKPYLGDGLADSFSLAINQAGSPSIRSVFASLNGENFGARELGVAVTRNSSNLDSAYTILHPAECFGDIGAAFLPVSIGLAAFGFIKGTVRSPALTYASSESKYRGAVCVSKN